MNNMMDILMGELAESQVQIGRAISSISRTAHTLSLVLEGERIPFDADPLAKLFSAGACAIQARCELSAAMEAITRATDGEAEQDAGASANGAASLDARSAAA